MKASTAKVLRILRESGVDGVTTHDMVQAFGGSRFGARIGEPRDAGYVIDSVRLRDNSSRYRLVSEPDGLAECGKPSTAESRSPSRAVPDGGFPALGQTSGPRSAIFEPDFEAAA
jgi:hypothetical protein